MFRTRSQRSTARVTTLLGATVLAAALTGCGAGQISQTANQSSAINGGSANLGKLALRNIHLVGNSDPVKQRAGQKAELVLVIANESADVSDRLTSISSPDDIGKVTLSGDSDIPATGRLFVGSAEGQQPPVEAKAPEAAAPEAGSTETAIPETKAPEAKPQASSDSTITHGKAQLALTKDLADGLTYRFTFTFEKAGEVTVAVPIDAGPSAPRQHTINGGGHEGGEH
ncbi:hypothetical protein [Mycobacteroides franklinii]|uniref:Lipoprotein lpqE n=1 Tax=Mycobacteroides franklinii TaxID=948102 RepID=A0A4R8RHP3_9MYCO|nr:hypothetical protein [Mycobacteroides franklinii]ORA56136.1 hypothetical protein BST24_25245 [Mycobacteroides franklinii]TDH18532.1 hypothetical protein EJ571_18050 [Mycobacteroides franklinii]TDZ40981.1 hypothetical protein CCUG64054_04782 [Mycobacteroides franklinii]TDZ53709.1 hypothetical protein CCUG63697_00086 [Mycobacteroides franklinii]TDZ54296.1 hypothetical protein CCUG63696_04777 [Mycobacteroides franklinii]